MKSVDVNDQSGVAEARRAATDLAGRAGFTDVETGKLALVATELSTNLLKHGSGGEILVGTYDDNESQGIEIIALDKGAGMSNVAACLEDGYSSAGTPGRGLGSVIRQSHFVDIGSWPGLGTAVLARVAPGKPRIRQATERADMGRRLHRHGGPGRLWRRLECLQCGRCADFARRRRIGPRARCGGSIGRGGSAVPPLQWPYRHQPDRIRSWRASRHAGRRGLDRALRRAGKENHLLRHRKCRRHDRGCRPNQTHGVDGGNGRLQCPENPVFRLSVRAAAW